SGAVDPRHAPRLSSRIPHSAFRIPHSHYSALKKKLPPWLTKLKGAMSLEEAYVGENSHINTTSIMIAAFRKNFREKYDFFRIANTVSASEQIS
ncbi:MAG: hypothetical protein KDH84_10145, partial [Calditrichaeota bacterium]|nr:hypothetical protein [Calditrichota bacterium]